MNFKGFLTLFAVLSVLFASPVLGALDIKDLVLPATADPGTSVSGSFNLENKGLEAVSVIFTSTDLIQSTYKINGPTISARTVAAGSTINVPFTLNVGNNLYLGPYTGGSITATAGVESDTESLALTVNSKPDLTTTTSISGTIAKGVSDDFTLAIANVGNSPLANVDIDFSDLTSGTNIISSGQISLDKDNFNVDYTQSENVVVTINVPTSVNIGTYTGTFTVTTVGVTPKSGTVSVIVDEPVYSLSYSNPFVFTDAERDEVNTKTLTITNDGDFTINNIELALTGFSSSYDFSISETGPFNLNPGDKKDITAEVFIFDDEDSENKEIGEITLTSTELTTSTINVEIEAELMLGFEDLDFKVDGDSDDVNEDGGDTVKIKPGSTVEIKAKVENLYSSSDDIVFDDVYMEVKIDGLDDGDDVEEESDSVEIKEGKDKTLTVEFTVPLEVEDEETYDCEIEIIGEDENGGVHTLTVTVSLEAEKETHDMQITEFRISPSTISCERLIQIETEIINLGSKDEDEVVYTIKSNTLKIDLMEGGPGEYLDIESGEDLDDITYTRTHTISLPDTIKAGTYNVDMKLYRDRDDLEFIQTAQVTVAKCNDEPVDEDEDEDDEDVSVVITTPGTTGPIVADDDDVTTDSTSGLSLEWIVLIALAILLVIAFIVIIILLVK